LVENLFVVGGGKGLTCRRFLAKKSQRDEERVACLHHQDGKATFPVGKREGGDLPI